MGPDSGTAGYFLTQVITLSFYVVLARLAGPEVFGAFAAAWIIVGVSSFLAESGMSSALIQRNDRLEEAAATAVLSTFFTGAALALIALALSPLVGLYFDTREIGLLAAALSGVLFVNAAGVVPDALMRRRFSFVRRVVVDPISATTYGIVGVVTLYVRNGGLGARPGHLRRRHRSRVGGLDLQRLAARPAYGPRLRCGESSRAMPAMLLSASFFARSTAWRTSRFSVASLEFRLSAHTASAGEWQRRRPAR